MIICICIPFLSCSSPVTGPKAVRGQERGSLAVQCRYTPGWESHGKWWCRGADWGNCKILVQTTASEPEVKRDRVSIRDDRENRTFTVTTEELRLDDAGIYWCGIARVGTDHAEQVSVTVDPGKSLGGAWIEFPVLYSRTSLLIDSKCNSLHLLTPNSPSIPLPPPWQPQICPLCL
uniref:Ig-like domain-containing protein n=1 Tax=Sus scrofa TaxID=9823 RepID=A0A8D1MWB5_PIG